MTKIDGAVLRELRNLRGLSQPKLAHKSGVSPLTIKRIEKIAGPHDRRFDTVERLAKALDVQIDVLCGENIKEKASRDELFLRATGMTRDTAIKDYYDDLGERILKMTENGQADI
jgi:transcriptional regulator with XRE-family HTH domain